MRNFIAAYNTGAFSEEEICAAFNISHKTFRKHCPEPPKELPPNARREIREGVERNKTVLARLYCTTQAQISYALAGYSLTKDGKVDRTNDIRQLAADGVSRKDIASLLKIQKSKVDEVLRQPRSTYIRDQARAMLATGLYSQEEIANELGVSQSVISYYNEAKLPKPNRVRKTKEEWEEILADPLTVTELAKKYGVSRAEIYRRKAK